MTVKLIDLITASKALEALSSDIFVPKSDVWPLAKTVTQAKSEETQYQKARETSFRKYGEPGENGDILVKGDNLAALNAELSTMLNAEISVPLAAPLSIPDSFEPSSASKLTSQDLVVLTNTGFVVASAPKNPKV